jgi:hypothetical protein
MQLLLRTHTIHIVACCLISVDSFLYCEPSLSAIIQSQAAALLQLHANIIMRPRLSKHTRLEVGSRGADIIAAGAPLEAIVAQALTTPKDDKPRSTDAIRSACNLLSSSKGFQQAVSNCGGSVAVDFRPKSTEAAAAFAGGQWQ